MATTTAKGTLLKVGASTSPHTYASVGQVRSISGPSVKVDLPDITTHDTAGNARSKIAVLIDSGTISHDINFDDTDATHAFATGIWSFMVALALKGIHIAFPNAVGLLDFNGYVTGHEFAIPVDNVLSAKISWGITGAISAT